MRLKTLHILILLQLTLPGVLPAVESAPHISDREIVEKLAVLESNQKSLEQLINHRINDLNHRIGDLRSEIKTGQDDLRSEMKAGQEALRSEMRAGQEALRSEMRAGQEALGKRLDDLSKRISETNYTMLALFSALVVLIATLFGYIAWDRRTMIKPVVERVERLEKDLIHDLERYNTECSKIDRLINAMRELARTDEKVATVLRSFSLL